MLPLVTLPLTPRTTSKPREVNVVPFGTMRVPCRSPSSKSVDPEGWMPMPTDAPPLIERTAFLPTGMSASCASASVRLPCRSVSGLARTFLAGKSARSVAADFRYFPRPVAARSSSTSASAFSSVMVRRDIQASVWAHVVVGESSLTWTDEHQLFLRSQCDSTATRGAHLGWRTVQACVNRLDCGVASLAGTGESKEGPAGYALHCRVGLRPAPECGI